MMKFNQNAKGERGPESPNRPRSDRQIRPRFADNSKCQKQSLFAVYGAQYNAAGTNVDVQMGGTTSIIVNNDGGGRPANRSTVQLGTRTELDVDFYDINSSSSINVGGESGRNLARLARSNLRLGSFRPSSDDIELCESALAQRRSANLPKLRQLSSNITNLSFEQNSFRNDMGDISFKYADCDSFGNELSELYSYVEVNECATCYEAYVTFMQSKNLSTTWLALEKREKQTALAEITQSLELSSASDRLEAARALLYILQGTFMDHEPPLSEVMVECKEEARRVIVATDEATFVEQFTLLQAACNSYLVYESGLFKSLCELLLMEVEQSTEQVVDRVPSSLSTHSNTRSLSSTDLGASSDGRSKRSVTTMAENEMLRVLLSSLYHMVEAMRRREMLNKLVHVSDFTTHRLEQLQTNFVRELREPLDSINQPLLSYLLDLVPLFVRGSCARIPLKKVMLLAWKTMLATCGDMTYLKAEKAKRREAKKLPPIEDTISVALKMRSTNFSTAATSEAPAEPGGRLSRRYRGALTGGGNVNVSRAFNRQQALISSGAQLSDDDASSTAPLSTSPSSGESTPVVAAAAAVTSPNILPTPVDVIPPLPLEEDDNDDAGSLNNLSLVPDEPSATPSSSVEPPVEPVTEPSRTELGPEAAAADCQPPPPTCDTPVPSEGAIEQLRTDTPTTIIPNDSNTYDRTPPNDGDQTPLASSPCPRVLPWTSKARAVDIDTFLQAERQKFFGYKLPHDRVSLFGLPPPVVQSVEAMRRNLYTSLGELQAEEERNLNRYPFLHRETIENTPAEDLYRRKLPTLPTDSISLLKILLAAIPTPKAKSDSASILSDVLAKQPDATEMLSSSLNLDVVVDQHNVLEAAVRLAIDINRHKEIIVKATTAILINLLKHLKLQHVLQFENFSQQLVLTNCLPLVLKFLDQNLGKYMQSRNELAPLAYPRAVVHYARHHREWPALDAENVEEPSNNCYYLWRNVFSSVNLLRVLNKLTKSKHSRTMMLVVFKSAPILKRCLKIRLGIFQFYALKLLKMQARYLGRQWRRTNMDVISSIYMNVRHRLNDDWAFASETRCKSWDFQSEERELKMAIEKFNNRRYGQLYPDLAMSVGGRDHDSSGSRVGDNDEGNESGDDDLDAADLEPVDNSIQSVLSQTPEFTAHFKQNYERWLESAVFRNAVDWDAAVLTSTPQLERMLSAEKAS